MKTDTARLNPGNRFPKIWKIIDSSSGKLPNLLILYDLKKFSFMGRVYFLPLGIIDTKSTKCK